MIKKNKQILMSVLVASISFTIMGCESKIDLQEDVVQLEEQKSIIDQNIIVKSVANFEEFQADRWLKDGSIIGIKNQPVKGKEDSEALITVYDVENKEFENLVKGKKKEWLMLEESSKDESELIYLSLIDGDFQRNLYNFNILDMRNKETKEVLQGVASISELKNEMLYIGKGMKIYKYGFNMGLKEIKLPEGLINELRNLDDFTFEDYIEMYYKRENFDENNKKQIKENYEYSKLNNNIIVLDNLGDEVKINSSNRKIFNYNIENGTYELENKSTKFTELERASSKQNMYNNTDEKVYREFKDDGTKVLWKLDESGNKEKIIEKFSSNFSNMSISPDGNKVVYNTRNEDETESSFIYDLNTDEKIKIYPDVIGSIHWNNTSDKFFIEGRKFDTENLYTNMTSLIELK